MKIALILVALVAAALLAFGGPLWNGFKSDEPAGPHHSTDTTLRSVRQHTKRADALLLEGDVDQALLHYRYARHLLEEHAEPTRLVSVLRGLARAYRALGDRGRALEALTRALREHYDDPACALDLARLAWQDAVARMDESPLRFARQMARRAEAQVPGDPGPAELGRELERLQQAWNRFYRQKLRDDETLDALGRAFGAAARSALREPGGPYPVEALLALDHGLRHLVVPTGRPDPLPRTDARRRELQECFDATFQDALTRTEQETSRHPRGAAFWFTRGEVLRIHARRTGDTSSRDRALAAYGQAVKIDPGFGPAVIAACRMLQTLDRDQEAFPLVEAAVEHLLRTPAIHALETSPGVRPQATWRGPPRVKEAVEILLDTAGRHGAGPRWKALAARMLEQMLQRLETRVQSPPDRDRADAWYDLGWLASVSGRTLGRPELQARAAEALEHALALDPSHAEARRELALVKDTLKNLTKEKP